MWAEGGKLILVRVITFDMSDCMICITKGGLGDFSDLYIVAGHNIKINNRG